MSRVLLYATSCLSVTGLQTAAFAQAMEEIVVTAQFRSERLQDVPLSISALGREELERMGAINVVDAMRQIPGVSFVESSSGQARYAIRGINSTTGLPTIGLYIDDVPVTARNVGSTITGAADPRIVDLERIEVLRGPQGTLYGASSMGGTIRLILAEPDLNTLRAFGVAELASVKGGGLTGEVGAIATAPLVEDRLAVRGGFNFRSQAGYIDRVDSTGTVLDENVNREESYSGRLAVKAKPFDNFTLIASGLWQKTDIGARNFFLLSLPQFQQDDLISTPGEDRLGLYSLTAELALPNATVTSITGFYKRDYEALQDYTRISRGFFLARLGPAGPAIAAIPSPNIFKTNFEQFSQEVRIASSDDTARFRWIVGAFYQDYNQRFQQIQSVPGINDRYFGLTGQTLQQRLGIPAPDDIVFQGDTRNDERQKAVFGEATLRILEGLEATIGLRGYWVDQTLDRVTQGPLNGGRAVVLRDSSENGTTPKFGLSYRAAKDVLLYAVASKGFRVGGPNVQVPTTQCEADLRALGLSEAPGQFESDTVWSYEVGAKTQFLQRRATLNIAAYRLDWQGLQQNVFLPGCGFGFIGNVGKARSTGGELELNLQPTDRLTLGFGVGYIDATLRADAPSLGARSGDRVLDVPNWTVSLSLDHRFPITEGLDFTTRADLVHRDDSFREFSRASPGYRQPAYDLANLRLGIAADRWSAALFMNNVFDTSPTLQNVNIGGGIRGATTLAPRTIGITYRHEL